MTRGTLYDSVLPNDWCGCVSSVKALIDNFVSIDYEMLVLHIMFNRVNLSYNQCILVTLQNLNYHNIFPLMESYSGFWIYK